MKHRFAWMSVVFVALLVSAGLVGAQMAIPFEDSFESYSNQEEIVEFPTGAKGWQAETNGYCVASNMSYGYTAASLPLGGTHATVACLQTEGNAISNTFLSASLTNVWLDMMVQMVEWGQDEVPALVTNDTQVQTAIYLATGGLLRVFHGVTPDFVSFPSNDWTTLSHTPIETSSWHRLTVNMDYQSANAFKGGWFLGDLPFFQVQLDGEALTNATAYMDPGLTDGGGTGGSWFLCANKATINAFLSATLLSGTGYFDDFVVTDTEPIFEVQTTAAGIPLWWLTDWGLDTDDGVFGSGYDEGDGVAASNEWLCATDPTDSNSFCRIDAAGSDAGQNWVEWNVVKPDGALPGFTIQQSADLTAVDGGWSNVGAVAHGSTDGVRNWKDSVVSDVKAFYRLLVTGP